MSDDNVEETVEEHHRDREAFADVVWHVDLHCERCNETCYLRHGRSFSREMLHSGTFAERKRRHSIEVMRVERLWRSRHPAEADTGLMLWAARAIHVEGSVFGLPCYPENLRPCDVCEGGKLVLPRHLRPVTEEELDHLPLGYVPPFERLSPSELMKYKCLECPRCKNDYVLPWDPENPSQ